MTVLLPAYNVRVHVRHLDPIAFFMTKIETTVLSTDGLIDQEFNFDVFNMSFWDNFTDHPVQQLSKR